MPGSRLRFTFFPDTRHGSRLHTLLPCSFSSFPPVTRSHLVQIARDILKNKDDKTKISMLYANQTENDILCRNELEEMVNDELGR